MKKLLTIAIVAAGLAGVSTAVSADDTVFSSFPAWAQEALTENGYEGHSRYGY